jgi:hypothetical protein
VITDSVDARRRPRGRIVIPVVAGAAVCLVALGAWVTFAVRGEEGRDEQAREIQLEVTSDAGQVNNIVWQYPDDGNRAHFVDDGPMAMVKTPWSQRIEVKATEGPINISVLVDPDSTEATCRILVNGRVMEEQTGNFLHCMITVQRAFPAS